MKHSLFLLFTLVSSNLHAEFTPLIRQTTTFDDPNSVPSVKILSDTSGLIGSAIAAESVEKSAFFELFSVDSETNTEASHDKKVVATYLPQARIEVITLDSNGGVPKTRVGSPFDVKITVDGLITNDPNAQDASKWVNLYHTHTEYAAGENEADGNEVENDPNTPIRINKNNELTYTSDDAILVSGEENITVFAQPDFGFPIPTELASAKVLVYPLTTGALAGIEPNETIQYIENVTATMTNIYPGLNDLGNDSSWNVLCYSGTKKASHNASTIEDSTVVHVGTKNKNPESFTNQALDMDKIRGVMTGKGYYTIELIQSTIHGIDYLDAVTFFYNTDIKINGNITSGN